MSRAALGLLLLLAGCVHRSDVVTDQHQVVDDHQTEHQVERSRESASSTIELGPTIETHCLGAPADCAAAMQAFTDAYPHPVSAGTSTSTPAGKVELEQVVRLPVGADPRQPPNPGLAAPAVRVTSNRSERKVDDAHVEDVKHGTTDTHVAAHTTTEVARPWWLTWLALALAAVALFLLLRFTALGRAADQLLARLLNRKDSP
jgi:hypothetical protein